MNELNIAVLKSSFWMLRFHDLSCYVTRMSQFFCPRTEYLPTKIALAMDIRSHRIDSAWYSHRHSHEILHLRWCWDTKTPPRKQSLVTTNPIERIGEIPVTIAGVLPCTDVTVPRTMGLIMPVEYRVYQYGKLLILYTRIEVDICSFVPGHYQQNAGLTQHWERWPVISYLLSPRYEYFTTINQGTDRLYRLYTSIVNFHNRYCISYVYWGVRRGTGFERRCDCSTRKAIGGFQRNLPRYKPWTFTAEIHASEIPIYLRLE